MKFYKIFPWFKRNLKEIYLSQRKTLAYLVFGLINSGQVGVAAIGRGMKTGTTVRHNIKRVARFLANKNFFVRKALLSYQLFLISNLDRVILALDWTTIDGKGFAILKASIVGDGRSLPFAFKTYYKKEIKGNQTNYEKQLLSYIKSVIPSNKEVFIIADRGFGAKPLLLEYIQDLGFYYIARSKEGIIIDSMKYHGLLSNFQTKVDHIYTFEHVIWPDLRWKSKKRQKNKLESRFIIIKRKNMKQRWVLVTNHETIDSYLVILIYNKRMTIEETFKDEKNIENGFRFKKMTLSSAERYDKMLLIICYAYLFLTLLGVKMERLGKHRLLMANTVKYRSISLFQVGKYYYNRYDVSIPQLLKFLKYYIFLS